MRSTNKTPEYLHAEGTTTSPDTVFIARQPLTYLPGTSTELNRSRLPDPPDLQGMDLAYRQQHTDADSESSGAGHMAGILILSLLLPPIALILAPMLKPAYLLGISGAFSFAILLGLLASRRANPVLVLAGILAPPLAALLLWFFSDPLCQ